MQETNNIKLTQFSKAAGCGCKISPEVLKNILQEDEDFPTHPHLIVGHESSDDAAVYDQGNGTYLISTVDFFMPIVDNPYDFGKIAATNALSDVYAMGGTPLMAVAILGWPIEKLPASVAKEVLRGARFMCRMAGIPLAGGHSVDSQEPIFGLHVTGSTNNNRLKKNNTVEEGDLLFLTKPLGLGIVTTAAKRGLASDEDLQTAINYMCTLNRIGEFASHLEGVHAMTDVTGFGLLGHLKEMVQDSEFSAELNYSKIPLLPGLSKYLDQFIYPDMTTKTFSSLSSEVSSLSAAQLFTLCDPQTSGGLLIAVSPEAAREVQKIVSESGLGGICDQPIGRITVKQDKRIVVLE
jgi:selenide,water dikinase